MKGDGMEKAASVLRRTSLTALSFLEIETHTNLTQGKYTPAPGEIASASFI